LSPSAGLYGQSSGENGELAPAKYSKRCTEYSNTCTKYSKTYYI